VALSRKTAPSITRGRNIRKEKTVSLLCPFVAICPAFAEPPDAGLPEIVATASRWEEPVERVPQGVEVVETSGFGFAESASAAIRKSTFAPAVRGGKTVLSQVLVPVRFILHEGQ
jgi:hypothetical protein